MGRDKQLNQINNRANRERRAREAIRPRPFLLLYLPGDSKYGRADMDVFFNTNTEQCRDVHKSILHLKARLELNRT